MTWSTSRDKRAVTVLVAVAAASVALVASPASAATPAWETQTVPTTNADISVLPLDGQNAFAKSTALCFDECTSSPKLWQKSGTTWKQLTPAADAEVGVLAGTATDDLWVFGSRYATTGSYRFNHYDGTSWTSNLNPEPKNAEVLDAQAVSRTSVWAVGNYRGEGSAWYPMVTHWNGSAWTTTKFTGIDGEFETLDVNSDTDIWAVGFRNKGGTADGHYQGLVMHYDGTSWTEVSIPEVSGENYILREVISNGPNDAWVAAGSKVSHWDGTAWSRRDTPASWPSFAYYGGQLYAGLSTSPKLVRWNGSAWQTDSTLTKGTAVDELATTADGSLYAVSDEGNVLFGYTAYLSRLAASTS
ncbi:hypothetical protein [Streptomyces sp. YKOK-I1]